MKKAFLFLLMMAVCGNAYSAELLIQAKPHWMDSLTKKEVLAMDESTRQNYEARTKIGDVIAVRPDGWAWGKEEGLPNYIVVKVPMTVEEAQKYEEQLVENVQYESVVDGKAETITTQVLKRRRKYAIPAAYVSTAKTAEKTDVSIASKDVTAFKSAIIEKVGLSAEVKPPVKDTIKTDLQSFYKKHLQKYVAVARTFWIENAWAATQLKKTVCPSGCDYTALETCMNANEQNLVTADKYFDVEISGTWASADTTIVVVHNYTTDATRYINIYTTGDARHDGREKAVSGRSNYLLTPSGVGTAVTVQSGYIRVDGLEISGVSGNYTFGIFSAGYNTIKNNIVRDNNDTPEDGYGLSGIGKINDGAVSYIYNNIIYNISHRLGYSNGIRFYDSVGVIYNNTVFNIEGTGILAQYQGTFRNNISMGCGTDFSITSSATQQYSLSEDATATGTGSLANKTIANQFVSVTAGAENFHLKVGADAIDAGTDLSGTFTTDIDGDTRTGTWDIGADEYVSASRRRMMIIQ